MGIQIQGEYLGEKKVKLIHGPSGATIITAAPKDNQGDGSSFSPSDLVASAFGACMLTIMAIHAEREKISLQGTYFSLEKNMVADPRRIASLPVVFHLPKVLSPEQRKLLEALAPSCPVCCSLYSDIKTSVQFLYDV